ETDQFGYQSDHYIMSLRSGRAEKREWAKFAGLKAEIQVRTALQHAWAAVDHKLNYKPERETDRPQIGRGLSRLAAMFELADEEFSRLRDASTSIELAQAREGEIFAGDTRVTVETIDTYVEASDEAQQWISAARQSGIQVTTDLQFTSLQRLDE